MPALDLFLHEDFVGTIEPDARDRSRVTLAVDRSYRYPAGPLSAGQILAGCIVTGNDPDWRCSDCGHQW
jgi:hypothetical protein